VPFIKCGAVVVSELLPIVSFVEKKGYSLTQKLRPELTSTMAAYIDMVNNVLLSAEVTITFKHECHKKV
jgi:metaxin-2, putative